MIFNCMKKGVRRITESVKLKLKMLLRCYSVFTGCDSKHKTTNKISVFLSI